MSDRAAVTICATCGVEHARPQGVCAICADERQYLPPGGQRWTTFAELDRAGHRAQARELEPGLLAITVEPRVGIGHESFLVSTPAGSLLWDPVGFLDAAIIARVRALGPVRAIASSHPHMRLYDNFGHVIASDAAGAIRRSADRYRAWVSGAFDHLT